MPIGNIILIQAKIPITSGIRQGCSFLSLLFNILLTVLARTIKHKKIQYKVSNSERKKWKFCLCELSEKEFMKTNACIIEK